VELRIPLQLPEDGLVRSFAKYNQNDQDKEDQVGRAYSTDGEKWNKYRILMGKPKGKRPLGRRRSRWEDNIKMDLREMGWYELD
jgi:hypothetical protein